MHDLDDQGMPHSRHKRSFYETLSNFTRTSAYNLYIWGKSSFSSSTTNYNNKENIIKNVTPRVDNEVQETPPPLPIPRVKFRKTVEYIPENGKHCKCTSSDPHHHVRIDDLSTDFNGTY